MSMGTEEGRVLRGYLTECPMVEAPSCLRWALIRVLELGGSNYLTTNWVGFAEYFRIDSKQLGLRTARELVGYWIDQHPSFHSNTVQKVIQFARERNHQKLLKTFREIVQG